MIDIPEDQIIVTTNGKIGILENDIFYIRYNEDVALELSDFKESLGIFLEKTQEKPYKIIVEFPMHTYASAEARAFAMETSLPAIAEAVVFKSLAQRIIIRFYLLVNKQTHPVKIFTETEDAIKWLNTQ